MVTSQHFDPSHFFEYWKSKSPGVHSGSLCKGFRNADPQSNVIVQSTDMSPLVSMLVQTFLNPLKCFTYDGFRSSQWSGIDHQYATPMSLNQGETAVCGSSILCWMTGEAITCCWNRTLRPPGHGLSFTYLVRWPNSQWLLPFVTYSMYILVVSFCIISIGVN